MVISSKVVQTRKPHRCWGCAIEFPKKASMTKINWAEDGYLNSFYWCEICDAYWQEFMAGESDGISQGDLAGEDHYKEFKRSYIWK